MQIDKLTNEKISAEEARKKTDLPFQITVMEESNQILQEQLEEK